MAEAITWTTERRRLKELDPWPRNPRQIKKDQARRLDTSIEEFGQVETLAVGPRMENGKHPIYNGHARYNVLLSKHGKDYEVEVRVASRPLTEKEREKLTIYLHEGAAGEWNMDALANWDMEDLAAWGFDLEARGLELPAEPKDDPGPQIDRAEELREKWGVEPGQLWRLGEHRLICGDCTDRAVVERVMGGEKADMLLNDPPYGMRLDADFSGMVNNLAFAQEKGVKNGKRYSNVIGDHEDYDASPVLALFEDVKEQFWWGADYYSATLGDTMHQGAWLAWDKRLDESADKMYGSCFELLWSRQKHKRDMLRHKWAGIFGTEKEPQRGRMHPNQKPVELYEDLLTRYSEAGAIVVDCYSGSGTTLIACERLGRKCRACEISSGYVGVTLERFYQMTGIMPELLESA